MGAQLKLYRKGVIIKPFFLFIMKLTDCALWAGLLAGCSAPQQAPLKMAGQVEVPSIDCPAKYHSAEGTRPADLDPKTAELMGLVTTTSGRVLACLAAGESMGRFQKDCLDPHTTPGGRVTIFFKSAGNPVPYWSCTRNPYNDRPMSEKPRDAGEGND